MDFLNSVIAPIIVGIAIALFEHWLNHRDNDKK